MTTEKNSSSPAVGTIGFYRPDPGGPMSPMRMLGEADGQYMIFQINQELSLTLDKDEWMPLQEMWLSTHDMLLGKHDDLTLPMLFDRIHSLVCALQHINKRMA